MFENKIDAQHDKMEFMKEAFDLLETHSTDYYILK